MNGSVVEQAAPTFPALASHTLAGRRVRSVPCLKLHILDVSGWKHHPDAPMRYIRFLKTPRVVTEKGTSRSQVSCLITITSDLGDSFLPYHVHLSAELLASDATEEVLVWRTVQWSADMRSLPILLPLTKSRTSSKLRVRVGMEPKSKHDTFDMLGDEGSCGIVSAWSSSFTPLPGAHDTEKLVERRFTIQNRCTLSIVEETGESIARHLW